MSENGIIKILPDFIANQIAAGEVVQKPESVVKELVENSLDAGADSVAVIVKNAGKNLLHIVDNGNGMSNTDLALSIRRHATSKVFSQDDLEEIKTFGFRGEALASVCSVANIEIRTKRKNDNHGWQLISEPSKPELIQPINCDNGTQIFVRNLFYNVPARRKFLKSNMTEFRYISDTMIKFALSKPDIRFTFYDEDLLIFDVKPATLEQRIFDIMGKSVAESLIEVNFQNDLLRITGYLGMPQLAKQNRSGQYFFLNGRSVFSANLAHAVSSVYEHILDKNQKPLFILNIEINYKKVDVNVHPQKHEVKFEDERYVYSTLKTAAVDSLSKYNLIPNISLIDAGEPFITINSANSDQVTINKITGEIIERNISGNFNRSSEFNNNYDYYQNRNNGQSFNPRVMSAYDEIFRKSDTEPDKNDFVNFTSDEVFQLFDRFIIHKSFNQIVIIDQMHAHQRILFDKFEKGNQSVSSQKLLFPLKLCFVKDEILKFNDFKSEFENIGYVFEINENSIDISEVPSFIPANREKEISMEIIKKIISHPLAETIDTSKFIISIIAESSAIKNGTKLNKSEMLNLVNELKNCKESFFSPSGKRTFVKLDSEQFYLKLFKN
jgi:DNA mismatch repair protein MutL